jgi:lysophospholipase L1-like esterase
MSRQSVVLLGDSILDNQRYTTPEPDTAAHLQRMLGDGWLVDLVAQDGATIYDMPRQLRQAAGRTGTAVLSIGGNDVTRHLGLLTRPAVGATAVFEELLAIADDFGSRYEAVARAVADHFDRTILCTIYEVQLEPAPVAQLARVPLAVLNDRIIRSGARSGLEILELRDVCTSPSDFVLQIEPSAAGATKIAAAIAATLQRPSAGAALIHSAVRS